jgi:hypothetical protein
MRSNRSFDTDTHRQDAARRADNRTSRGALPLRAGHSDVRPQVNAPNLLDILRALEVRLHSREMRSDTLALGELLHPAFREFGRSGTCFTRAQVLSEFVDSPQEYDIWSQDYEIEELAPGLALLTYRSAHINQIGGLERHTLRASRWQSTPDGWKMRFHQGTPTGAFEKNAV